MPQNLRSILWNSSRVKKPSRPAQPKQCAPLSSRPRARSKKANEEEGSFEDKLTDMGTSQLLAEELTLRDVVQAMRYIRSRMFTPVPQTGLRWTRRAEVLKHRASMPPVVTLGHLDAVLGSATKTEREVFELVGKGVLRKVRVERRGGMGESVMETADLEGMVRRCGVAEKTADGFLAFLREHATAQALSSGALSGAQTDELVRAGFLTSSTQATAGSRLDARPEDRTTLTSIQHVSRFASGTVSAVGGRQAIHMAGGGAPALTEPAPPPGSPGFRIAVPGHGRYLKLASGAVGWLRDALGTTTWGEAPEGWLRERFEAGGLRGTRWSDFAGVEWEWVLGQAVGLGVVEIFETGTVGRGVRARGGGGE